MLHIKKIPLLLIIILSQMCLYSQTRTTFTPLSVGEHWSRRGVREDGDRSRWYYRPDRFEYMQMETDGSTELQIRGVLTQKATSVDITLRINNAEQRHTLGVLRNDDNFYYIEPLNLTLPPRTQYIYIRTRNPHAYFRAYRTNHRQMRPRLINMTPIAHWQSHYLTSPATNSLYYSGNSEHPLIYRADTDGSIHFFIRAIRDGRKAVTVDIYKNDTLIQTSILPNRTSSDYMIGDKRVTTGMRIELLDIKRGDRVKILSRTEHEIITRFFLTTREVF